MGVGTKLKVAFAVGRHDTIGQDLVNHLHQRYCRAWSATAVSRLRRRRQAGNHVFRQLLSGLAKACKAAHCALIGGETAQMPGMYRDGEYDIAGTIVGVVDRQRCSMARGFDQATR